MKKLIAMGEALIDWIPQETGKGISDVEAFAPKVGGAPANVCAAYRLLGGESAMITQLGEDPFGDKIVNLLNDYNVGTQYIRRSHDANTSLAFVALREDGNREFSFYRKPGADMLYKPEYLKEEWFKDSFAFHFCSVSLGDFPMKDAHKVAIDYAKAAGALISFDPNLRFNLWDSQEALKAAVSEFIPMADVLKISDEELEFITGCTDIEDALEGLFNQGVKMVIYTQGADGASAYTRGNQGHASGEKVKAVDTTGAGDSFIGAVLAYMSQNGMDLSNLEDTPSIKLEEMLIFANHYSALSVQRPGAIPSYPKLEEL